MKNIIKIALWVICILFVFCITTSLAEDLIVYSEPSYWNRPKFYVYGTTTASDMVNALKAGKVLTNIGVTVKDTSSSIYCVQHGTALYPSALYTNDGNSVTYPDSDISGNGYARSYIYAVPGYIKNDNETWNGNYKDERQYALWCLIGQESDTQNSDLYHIAIAYQNYKKNEEKDVKVTPATNVTTLIDGQNLVYGPIKVEYSYKKASGNIKSDEWGGFQFAFFDKNGLNINSKVKLCTLSNGTYTPVNSTEITEEGENKGYYQIKETTYNNKNLYIVTQDKSVGSAILKIKENKVDYSATVTAIKGRAYKDAHYVLCQTCDNKMTAASESMSEVVSKGIYTAKNGLYLKYRDDYYIYTGSTTEEVYSKSQIYDVYRIGYREITTGREASRYTGRQYCQYCKTVANSNDSCSNIKNHYIDMDQIRFVCECGMIFWSEYEVQDHFNEAHITDKYSKKVYKFEAVGNNCRNNSSTCGTWLDAGYYQSQNLNIVETTEEKKSNEIKLDIEVKFATSVEVEKFWEDDNNANGLKPTSITVKLLADGVDTRKTKTLNDENGWKAVFEELDPTNASGKEINYSIQEVNVIGYKSEIEEIEDNKFKITNKLSKVDIPVTKIWNDNNNSSVKRPSEVIVKLLADGTYYENKTLTLNAANSWKGTFAGLPEYNKQGNVIKYTVEEVPVEDYASIITKKSNGGYDITNTYYHGYIEISGRVWNDGAATKSETINGTYDSNENGIEGVDVTLKNADGTDFETNGVTYKTKTGPDGTYTFLVNLDNRYGVYKLYENAEDVKDRIQDAYIEFGYDGMKYTTVATSTTGENTSKAIEDETKRNEIDQNYSTITSSTDPNTWNNERITASTKNVINIASYTDKATETRNVVLKKCNGDANRDGVGEAVYTNTVVAWNNPLTENHSNCGNTCTNPMKTFDIDIGVIKNVNLGLFEKEEPKIKLYSDVSRVIVEMNGQDYTYLYRNRGLDTDDGMKVKYEGRDYYTNSQEYMRPVNISDVAYMLDKAEEVLKVYVVYELKVANTSNSVELKVDDIINFYDSEYELVSVTNVGKQEELTNYETGEGDGYKTVTLKGLNITLKAGETSDKIELKYKVNKDTIEDLLQEQATLEHVSEILSYTTTYGTKTLYAEQRTHEKEVEKGLTGRGGTPYAGYDYKSHPGNAEIYYYQEWNILRSKQAEEAYIAKNGKGIESKAQKAEEQACAEHDTDFAPSFILKVGDAKTLSGTVYEDKDVNLDDEERLGNGKFDEGEKTVANVKVELYKLDGELAKLYKDINSTGEDAVTYTDANGNYALKGVVTSEYFVKFTYGDDAEKLRHEATTIDGTTTINARNYKSTIITNQKLKEIFGLDYSDEGFDKNWHINIEDNHSVAVDNMLDRLDIEDLYYKNFHKNGDGTIYIEPENMTAYTKPFSTEVEFDADGEGQSNQNGDIGISNVLSKLDFGIVERPREDLFVEKTIKYMKLVLANGQTLIDGDPRNHTLNYAKTMGFDQEITSGEAARKANPKRLLIEMDVELIQGAKLELQYEVKVTNNNELDYDYGTSADYADIKENKFITTSDKAKYYYFGDKTGLNEMKSIIEIVDYLSTDITYQEDIAKWKSINVNDLRQEGNELISDETYEAIKDGKYKVFTDANTSITLSRNETWTQDMIVSKSLANKEDNVYDNSLEILKIDGKTARTIQMADENGKQIEKLYKPGNYIPASANGEQDDDLVDVIITPPTGISAYVITYLITGVVGLIVIAVVIIFIKKKGLTK